MSYFRGTVWNFKCRWCDSTVDDEVLRGRKPCDCGRVVNPWPGFLNGESALPKKEVGSSHFFHPNCFYRKQHAGKMVNGEFYMNNSEDALCGLCNIPVNQLGQYDKPGDEQKFGYPPYGTSREENAEFQRQISRLPGLKGSVTSSSREGFEKTAISPLVVGLGIRGLKHLKKKYDTDEGFRDTVDGFVGGLIQKGTDLLTGDGEEESKTAAAADGMSPYIDVLSDNMLRHRALPSSPETLCGKQVADIFRPSALDEDCDICMTLGAGFVNEAKLAQVEPDYDFDAEELTGLDPDDDEFDDDDDEYDWDFDEDEGDEYELPDGDDVGTFVNSDEDDEDEDDEDEADGVEGGYFGLGDENASFSDSVLDYFREDEEALKDFIEFVTERRSSRAAAAAKVALNYTLDGQKIVDGFKVMMTSQEASSLPYLDTNRVTISEKVTCNDCNEPSWLQTVASCRDCNQFKCASCMESMKDFSGICRRCANSLDGTIGEEPIVERDLYLDYFLNNETEAPLFLPEGE